MAVPQNRGNTVSIKTALSRETESATRLQVFIWLLSCPALHILNLFQALLKTYTSEKSPAHRDVVQERNFTSRYLPTNSTGVMEAPHVDMGRGFDAPDEALLVEHPFFVHTF